MHLFWPLGCFLHKVKLLSKPHLHYVAAKHFYRLFNILLGSTLILLTTMTTVKSQSVVGVTGSSYTDSQLQIEWSIGELAITTLQAGETILTQGFLQPYYTMSYVRLDRQVITDLKAFPNPCKDLISLSFSDASEQDVSIKITDVLGRPLETAMLHRHFSDKHFFDINLSHLPSGVYVFSLLDARKEVLQSVKVIKSL